MRLATLIFLALAAPLPAAPRADISEQLARILAGSKVPALAAAAVVKDEIVAAGATGVRKAGRKTVVTVEDKFHIGSNTKSMTATLAAILVREKKIGWDTTIDESFRGMKIHPEFSKTTLEQLLSNTGGFPRDVPAKDWTRLWQLKGPPVRHREGLAKIALAWEPAYPPGKGYQYSNTGFALGGAMLERAARKSYEDLLTKYVFKPLQMSSAGFRAPGKNGSLTQPLGHRPDPKSGELTPIDPEPSGDNPNAIAPAGLVHCSIIDHARYARAHLGHGPRGFLTTRELEFLHRPRRQGESYALGWGVDTKPWAQGPALNHTGSNTMWFSVIWLAPNRDFAAVAACNSGAQEGFQKCDQAVQLLIKLYLQE